MTTNIDISETCAFNNPSQRFSTAKIMYNHVKTCFFLKLIWFIYFFTWPHMSIEPGSKWKYSNRHLQDFQPSLLPAGCSTVFTLTCGEPDKVTGGPFSQVCYLQLLLETSFRRRQLSATIIYYHKEAGGRRAETERRGSWVTVCVCVFVILHSGDHNMNSVYKQGIFSEGRANLQTI